MTPTTELTAALIMLAGQIAANQTADAVGATLERMAVCPCCNRFRRQPHVGDCALAGLTALLNPDPGPTQIRKIPQDIKPMPTNWYDRRNAGIHKAYLAGAEIDALAETHMLQPERIRRIIKAERAKAKNGK